MNQIYDESEFVGLTSDDLSYSLYTNQCKMLREFLIEKIGIEKVAQMGDREVEKEIENMKLIPMCIYYQNGADYEEIFLVPYEDLKKYKRIWR